MKKKLFITLFIVTICAIGIGLYITKAMQEVVLNLNNIVKVHKVQILQEQLVFQLLNNIVKVHKVQLLQEKLDKQRDKGHSQFVPISIQFAEDVNSLSNDVMEMSDTMSSCYKCHHSEETVSRLDEVQSHMEKFKYAMSRTFTLRANSIRYKNAEESAIHQGRKLALHLNDLIISANKQLGKRAKIAMVDITNRQKTLKVLVLCVPFIVLLVGFYLLKSFTTPLSSLLRATRKLTGGDLEYRVTGLHHEFGELAESFNSMAESIRQQMKDMQRAEQMAALGQLAAGLAHEIKNPLAGIKVSMEVLANELDIDEEDRRILRLVILEINHINALINELLNYARPSKPNFESVSIHKVLDKTIETASYSIQKPKENGTSNGQRGIVNFIKNFAPGNLQVHADPVQLHQIFLNILLNGIEIMPKGGEIKIKTFLAEGTDYIGIKIKDTGPGLDKETQEKLFEPFYTTKKKGTGLGLAISKRLVEQQDGEIVANSNVEGSGATFSVYLPIDSNEEGSLEQ